MTDLEKEAREKAEEIGKRLTLGVYSNDEDLARDEGYNDGYVAGYEDGYIAGAEAHQMQWHDLEKDPNDVPKRPCDVLNQEGVITAYQPDRGFLGFGGIGIQAWCEIPTFKK